MKPYTLIRTACLLTILGSIGLFLNNAPAQSQAARPKTTAPELHLAMDLIPDQSGLEQIFKTQTDRAPGKACPGRPGGNKITKEVFVNFQLATANSNKRSTLFEYKTGNNLATYWVNYIREVRHLNRDGNTDLVFYAGDDTSDEIVLLLMQPNQVKAVYAGSTGHSRESRTDTIGEIVRNGKQLSRWDPEREVFVGDGIAWTVESCVPIRKTPDAKGEILLSLSEHQVVMLSEQQGKWQKIAWEDGTEGWVETRQISKTSPTRIFSLTGSSR
jgi:hypothetical protein